MLIIIQKRLFKIENFPQITTHIRTGVQDIFQPVFLLPFNLFE